MKLLQMRHRDKFKKRVYSYAEVVGQCKKVPGGSLLAVRGAYLPILVRESHWVGAAIMPDEKRIVFYDPDGEGLDAKYLVDNLLRLVVDEYKRDGNRSQAEIDKFRECWSWVDMSCHYPK